MGTYSYTYRKACLTNRGFQLTCLTIERRRIACCPHTWIPYVEKTNELSLYGISKMVQQPTPTNSSAYSSHPVPPPKASRVVLLWLASMVLTCTANIGGRCWLLQWVGTNEQLFLLSFTIFQGYNNSWGRLSTCERGASHLYATGTGGKSGLPAPTPCHNVNLSGLPMWIRSHANVYKHVKQSTALQQITNKCNDITRRYPCTCRRVKGPTIRLLVVGIAQDNPRYK